MPRSTSMDGSPGASDLSSVSSRYRVPTSIRRHQTFAGAPKWENPRMRGPQKNWAASSSHYKTQVPLALDPVQPFTFLASPTPLSASPFSGSVELLTAAKHCKDAPGILASDSDKWLWLRRVAPEDQPPIGSLYRAASVPCVERRVRREPGASADGDLRVSICQATFVCFRWNAASGQDRARPPCADRS